MMTFNRDVLGIELIFLPDYIVNALKSKNITIQDIDNAFSIEMRKFLGKSDEVNYKIMPRTAEQLLKQKLSKLDIDDLIVYNDLFSYKVVECSKWNFLQYVTGKSVLAINPDEINNSLSALYDNNMSINISNTFDAIPGSDCLYLVLHKGFTNFVLNNDYKLRCDIFGAIVDKVVIRFGEDRLVNSSFFKDYIKLLRMKSVKL